MPSLHLVSVVPMIFNEKNRESVVLNPYDD